MTAKETIDAENIGPVPVDDVGSRKTKLPAWVDLPLLVGAILTVAFYVIVFRQFPRTAIIHRYTTEHIVEYVVVSFFIWGIVDVVFKLCGFPLELLALRQPGLSPRGTKEAVDKSRAMYAELYARPRWFLDSRLGQRMAKALDYLQEKGSADGFEDYLRHLAIQDDERTYINYGLVRFICWVAPVLGILGTVVHFSSAFVGMSGDQLSENLNFLFSEIGTAFSTTTVALAAAITMMFSLFICERCERGIVHSINRRMELELLNRFEVVDETITPFLQAVQIGNKSTVDAMAGTLDKQMQIWTGAFQRLHKESQDRMQSQAQLWEQSLAKVHQQFEQSDAAREQKLLKLLTDMQTQRNDQKASTQTMVNQLAGVQTNFAKLVETLSNLSHGSGELVKLQQVLAENLRGLRETAQLDQALHGLTAAIHLMTARYDTDSKPKTSRAA